MAQPSKSRSIKLRAIVALIGMVVFYATCIALAVGLFYGGLALFQLMGDLRGGRALVGVVLGGVVCWGVAGVLIWSVIPSADKFEAPGPELMRAAQPELFAEIDAIAEATGQRSPEHVYLVMDFNAFVTERGGVMGFGTRRVMGLGVPLMQSFSVSEFRGVIAHEFGHFYGGDTKLSPFIYRTRTALVQTVNNLTHATNLTNKVGAGTFAFLVLVLRKPFEWFGIGFVRFTAAISRSQEIAADALACHTVGSAPMVSGFRKIRVAGAAFHHYLTNEVGPIVRGGFRPPVLAGFGRFLTTPGAQAMADAAAADPDSDDDSDPYDSHPPMPRRIEAALALDLPTPRQDNRLAISLLRDAETLEPLTLSAHVRELPPITWEDTITIFTNAWAAHTKQWQSVLVGMTVDAFPIDAASLRSRLRLTEAAQDASEAEDEDLARWARALYLAAFGCCLLDHGFVASTDINTPIVVSRGDVSFELDAKMDSLFVGEVDADAWRGWIGELGLAGVPLVKVEEAG